MNELITSFFLLAGGTLVLISALGIVRFPDVYTRMHAAAKTGTVGICSMAIAVAVHFGLFHVSVMVVLIIAFFFLTAPIAAHLIGRAAYTVGTPLWDKTVTNEYPRHHPKDALKEEWDRDY